MLQCQDLAFYKTTSINTNTYLTVHYNNTPIQDFIFQTPFLAYLFTEKHSCISFEVSVFM